jgi:hypothetical protein
MTDKEKYIGLVKWFHDQARDANYGFIQHAKLGDLFFHERSIEQGQDIKSFRENAIVVFVSQESKKHKGKLEAVDVKYLDNETDLKFLFSHFLSILTEKGKYSDYNTIQKGVHSKITSLLEKSVDKQIIEQLFQHFLNYVTEQIQLKSITVEEYLKGLLKVGKGFFFDNYKQIEGLIEQNISVELAHKLWTESFIETCQKNFIAEQIVYYPNQNFSQIIKKSTEEDKLIIYQKILFLLKYIDRFSEKFNHSYIDQFLTTIKSFYTTYKEIEEFILKNISEEYAHNLWMRKLINVCQINYISNIIISSNEQGIESIFNICSKEDKSNIFFKVLYNFESIDTEPKLKDIKKLLDLSREFAAEQHEKILTATINACPEYFKLYLWLEDYHEMLDFNSYKLYTVTLLPKYQKRFVKKVLRYIHEDKADISVEDLTSLNVMDFETSKLAEQIDNSHFDYSTSIILNVISELKSQTNIETRKDATSAQHRIYDLIIKQIKQPKDILQISGFFDECEGRCSVSVHEVKNEEGEVTDRNVTYNRNEHNKAKNHPICDGRKAVSKTTKEPVLSDKKVEFWWCANQKCFKPSRQLHSSTDWEKYSLLDFLTILKVDFKESDLEIYLNIINKANRFLKHLNCRKCNHILYPKGKTQYAFYGISHFACKTKDCSENGKEIYLSHCLNGYCEMVIDSRDSVKCKPNGLKAKSCGWYVCNYCHSCCSSEQLQRRKWVYDNIMHSEYKCHLEGHRNLGVISCNKCGDPMESNENRKDEYNKVLNWFISQKENKKHIANFGQRPNDNKWWFRLMKNNLNQEEFNKKLRNLVSIGFNIPNFNEEHLSIQFIAEPNDFKNHNSDILTCNSCGNILDLSNDLERARAVKKFHNVRFVAETVE